MQIQAVKERMKIFSRATRASSNRVAESVSSTPFLLEFSRNWMEVSSGFNLSPHETEGRALFASSHLQISCRSGGEEPFKVANSIRAECPTS